MLLQPCMQSCTAKLSRSKLTSPISMLNKAELMLDLLFLKNY